MKNFFISLTSYPPAIFKTVPDGRSPCSICEVFLPAACYLQNSHLWAISHNEGMKIFITHDLGQS
ncbi:MAG: hypothetical protein PUQ00_13450 [Nostoc sp. S13]|nr:hypothetical protein [Nostoc sp. S13]